MSRYLKFIMRTDMHLYLAPIKRRVYKKVGALHAEYVYSREPVSFEEKDKQPLKRIKKRKAWSKDHYGCAWFHFTGKVPETSKGRHIALLVGINGEGNVPDENGTPVQTISNVGSFIEAFQPSVGKRYIDYLASAEGGENIDIWMDAGNNKLAPGITPPYAVFKQCDIVEVRDDIKSLYYDMLALSMQLAVTEKGSAKAASIHAAVKAAASAAKPYNGEAVAKAREILRAEMANGEEHPFTVYSTGHAHLDLAWLWPIRETKRKAGRTFSNALRNIERYPDYVFGASQPQQFEWMEEKYPALFEEIKTAVAEGRLEVQGGMWVECDTNVTSGESLIRQNLYGKKYWKEKFGKDMNFCWLPDVFGFSGNLPQILKKCGMDYFLTIKLSWNEHNKFPKRTFVWEGIDDSQVLVHMPPEENYNSDATPLAVDKAYQNYPEKDKTNFFGMLYGVGDGGGGPGEGHIEMATRMSDMKGLPKVVLTPAQKLFDELGKVKNKLDVYKGELYLEKHQGTYTTQGKNKYFNRKIEFLLHNVEFLATAAAPFGMGYPKAELDKIWKEILLYQFHDIIPGSSIKRVYDESVARYEKIYDELIELQNKALSYLKGDKKLSAVNTTSYKICDLIRKDDKLYKVCAEPYSAAVLTEYPDNGIMKATNDSLESDLYIVKFGKDGSIASLFDKKLNREFTGKYLNKLIVYKDKRLHYNAWDIDINYTKRGHKEFHLIGYNTKIYPGVAVRENLYSFGRSSITQKVILTEGKPVIEFSTVIDWQETHKMLRAEFEPSVFSDEVTCDIQMGNLKRTTKDKTSVERAQFEICAHKWVDVSDKEAGVSILTDCKYGWRVKEGKLSLNLLRSPMWPAKDADKGTHTIRYAVYPHAGDVYTGDTAKQAYLFNNPLIVTENEIKLPSAAQSSMKNVVIETIKTAESGEGTIIRAYEDSGKTCKASLTLSKDYTEAYETDMLENVISPVNLKELTFKPFEIKTLLIK